MTGEAHFVLYLLATTVLLFLSNRIRLDMVALLVIVVLATSGVLTPQEAVAGFGDTIVVMIAGLFVIGESLTRTGVATAIGAWLLSTAGSSATALKFRLMVVVALLSAFMSSTGAVAIFIPVAMGLSRKAGVPARQLLLPMAFAALLGGTLTLIGTPPNIAVNGALAEAGLQVFEFHSFTPIGLILLAAGILYMLTIGARLLPANPDQAEPRRNRHNIEELLRRYALNERIMLLAVQSASTLVGRSLGEVDMRGQTPFTVIVVQRKRRFGDDDVIIANQSTIIRPGDALLVTVAGHGNLEPPEGYGLVSLDRDAVSNALTNVMGVVEVVVAPRSIERGKTIRELGYRRTQRLHVLGLKHRGEILDEEMLEHKLKMGDTMLLGGDWRDIDNLLEKSSEVLLLTMPTERAESAPAYRRAPWALGIIGAMMVAMVTGALPAVIAVLAAGMALVATRCVTMPQAYRAVDWRSLVLIAGMLPMGTALAKTGALDAGVDQLVLALGSAGPLGLMAALFLLTAVLSQVISNTATAVLIAPVAIGVAEGLGVSPYPLVMAVAMAASAAFVTPVASPVNTLVLGPGGYSFADFVRVGLPLLMLTMALVLLIVPIFYPF
ncbi:MAG: di/tricarboxylate transporter [Candidatus Krumholzibacteriia bacterium]